MPYKAVFLDRDDTLINDPGYISDPVQVELLPGASKALIDIKKMGYKTIVVSNQSAVARGIITEKTLDHIHARLRELLGRQNAYLDAIYYCPFHPEGSVAKYRKESQMRKPNPGMLLQAAKEMDLDLNNSWMVGDSYRDIAAGKNAGCKTILINSSAHPVKKISDDPEPDYKAVNIVEAVNIIKMHDRHSHISVEAAREKTRASENPAEDFVETSQTQQVNTAPGLHGKFDINAAGTFEADDMESPSETGIPANMEPEQIASKSSVTEQKRKADDRKKSKRISRTDRSDANERGTLEQVAEEIEAIKTYAESALVNRQETDASESTLTVRDTESQSKTHLLLEDIHSTLKKIHRQAMFTEFSIFRLMAWSMQIIVFGLLILSLVLLLDVEKQMSGVYTTLAYAVVTQLMVIAFCFMSNRK